jgi:hypothetical protein
MSAAIEITQPLSKVDSAVDDTPASPSESKIRHRRTSSTVSGVFNINDLGELSLLQTLQTRSIPADAPERMS